ncbi:MAG TPA: hypothetical protein VHM48_12230 [Candidatus Limnocylindrales bacterium]|nr:hypothetical protein [Candidatus Limnocylindrales bacterium]
MSLVPQIIFSGSGIIVAAIGFYVRKDPRRGRATPFLMYLGVLLVGLAVLVTLIR